MSTYVAISRTYEASRWTRKFIPPLDTVLSYILTHHLLEIHASSSSTCLDPRTITSLNISRSTFSTHSSPSAYCNFSPSHHNIMWWKVYFIKNLITHFASASYHLPGLIPSIIINRFSQTPSLCEGPSKCETSGEPTIKLKWMKITVLYEVSLPPKSVNESKKADVTLCIGP